MLDRHALHDRRKGRIRHRIRQTNADKRLRLSVHRTNLHIYAQLIDDQTSLTVASASSQTEAFKKASKLKNGGSKDAAKVIGELIAKTALAKGIKDVVFDRSGYIYHGRVKELADAARAAGLNF